MTIITLSNICGKFSLNKSISGPKGIISIEMLRNQTLFKGLDDTLINSLRKYIHFTEYRKSQYIIHKGGAGDYLLLLLSGRLQVIFLSDEGKEVGLNFIEPGDFFGEISIIDNGSRSASVVATCTSVIGFLPKSQALWLFKHSPIVAERVLLRLCNMIRKEIHYRSNLISSKAYTRIYSVIFESTKFPNQTNAPSPVLSIENLPNQQTIASMANVSRETVSRALQALIKAGIIKKETKTIFIKNPILLEQLAKGEISMSQIKINHSIKNPTIDPL